VYNDQRERSFRMFEREPLAPGARPSLGWIKRVDGSACDRSWADAGVAHATEAARRGEYGPALGTHVPSLTRRLRCWRRAARVGFRRGVLELADSRRRALCPSCGNLPGPRIRMITGRHRGTPIRWCSTGRRRVGRGRTDGRRLRPATKAPAYRMRLGLHPNKTAGIRILEGLPRPRRPRRCSPDHHLKTSLSREPSDGQEGPPRSIGGDKHIEERGPGKTPGPLVPWQFVCVERVVRTR
jgi:hypothetical protein